MRSEIHPTPQTSMTKKACNTRRMIQRTTRKVTAFAFHTCRLALTSCSTNNHLCLPKNRSHQRTRLETRCTSIPWCWMSNGCLRKRLPNTHTHTSSESAMGNNMSARPNDKIGQKTLSRFRRCSYIAIASETDTCFTHPKFGFQHPAGGSRNVR